jgi:nitrogen regulatory protein PII-like uncharacterized protein
MAQEGNTMQDELSRIENLRKETESEMDIETIWDDAYKAVMAKEIAEETRAEARKQAEADILKRRSAKKGVSN